MDVSFQMVEVEPKRQKLDGGCKSLSNIPDVVLEQIISLLSTKDAIRTSILSKRWEYLWISIPDLTFIQWKDDKRSPLLNAVERVLVLRRGDIKRFSLSLEVYKDASRVNSWISAIVRRNVEELSLCLYTLKEVALPRCLFTCATLTELLLEVPCIFKVPSTVCLSSLRSLTLTHLVFSDEYSTQKLFSGCPVLEELDLHECNWGNLKSVSICAPKLETLYINENGLQIPSGSDGCQIMVFAVSLKYYSYRGEFLNDYCFYESSLYEAQLCPRFNKRLRLASYRMYKLLRGLCTAKILTICSSSFEMVQTNASELLAQIPLFSGLLTLALECESADLGSKGLLTMLENCPCLVKLIFTEGVSLSSDYAKEGVVLEPLPCCFLTSLDQIEVDQFRGDEDECHALKTLLKKVIALKKMSITWASNFQGGPEKKRDINKQLSDLPRRSVNCEVIINE